MLGKYPVMPDNVYLSGKKATTPIGRAAFDSMPFDLLIVM
jgi:hypothetical protein